MIECTLYAEVPFSPAMACQLRIYVLLLIRLLLLFLRSLSLPEEIWSGIWSNAFGSDKFQRKKQIATEKTTHQIKSSQIESNGIKRRIFSQFEMSVAGNNRSSELSLASKQSHGFVTYLMLDDLLRAIRYFTRSMVIRVHVNGDGSLKWK